MQIKKNIRMDLQNIIDDTTTAGITYIGSAEVGTPTSTDKWQIKVVDETGVTTEVKYPEDTNGSPSSDYSFIWNDRATYTYSIS